MGTKMYKFQQKLKSLKARIHMWNKEYFGNIFQDKKSLIERLEEIQRKGMEEGYKEDLSKKEKEILTHLATRE